MVMGITEATIEEIKSRMDIAELISSYGIAVQHAGSSLKACCPFHNEKTPSFHINTSKGFYHCFGCGESGDAIKFVQKYEGLSFIESVRKLGALCGVEISAGGNPQDNGRKRLYSLVAELSQFYRRCLLKISEASPARDYLVKRRLDNQSQEAFTIGYAPNGIKPILKWAEKYGYTTEELEAAGIIKPPRGPGDSGYHRFGSRLMFTICDKQGRAVGFSGRYLVKRENTGKYVNSPETPIFKKSKILFGFDKASGVIARSPRREVILCEGQIDVIRLHACGFKNAVASQGTAFTDDHAAMLKRVADCAVLMYDDDPAGQKAAVAAARKLLATEIPVRVVRLPSGSDPDSFLVANPPSALQKLIDGAQSIMSFQFEYERLKEGSVSSLDALNRVSKALIETLSACRSPILRSVMLDEASSLLSVPAVALSAELDRVKQPVVPQPQVELEEDGEYIDEDDFDLGESFAEELSLNVIAPTLLEFAFMEFLMSCEYDVQVNSLIEQLLPKECYASSFTQRFVDAWKSEAVSGEDKLSQFQQELSAREGEWFDKLILGEGRIAASALKPEDMMCDFARRLWIDKLKRDGNAMPSGELDTKRLKISMDIKRLQTAPWNEVHEMIGIFMKGDYNNGPEGSN